MLPLPEARRRVVETVPVLGSEIILVANATGRVLAEDILAPIDLPPFDTSSVDGYAVRTEDLSGADADHPVALRVTATVAAGVEARTPVTPGACQRLFTGAMLPPGADAVVMQEETLPGDPTPGTVLFNSPVKPLENIRFHGEDLRKGALAASLGTRLNFGMIALLSALGIPKIRASRQPSVGILSTGSELLPPGQPLVPGKIYECNRSSLAVLVERCGGIPQILPVVADDRPSTKRALELAFDAADVVVTIGGVSVGDFDLVRPVFEELGGVIHFWRIAIRPGKPFVFGRWREKVLIGLPGNPVSAAVCFWLLGRPALLAMQNARPSEPEFGHALLGETLRNRGDRPHFVRVRYHADGKLYAAGAQASHILSSMAGSDGLVEVPESGTLEAGAAVPFIPWN